MIGNIAVLVEADAERRRLLADRIAATGREVVPVRSRAEGARLAAALPAAVVFVVAEEGDGGADFGEAQAVRYPADLPLGGRGFDLAIRRVALALLRHDLATVRGLRELLTDLAIDAERGALVGDLASVPQLELLRALELVRGAGVLRTAQGEIVVQGGEVIAARAGELRAAKAFCRLALQTAGEVAWIPRAVAEQVAVPREIFESMSSLVLLALEDRLSTSPDLEARVRLNLGPQFFGGAFGPIEREILGALQQGDQIGALLDALPGRPDGEILRGLGALVRQGVAVLDEPQDRTRVITDTASDLPASIARAHGIRLVPYSLSFGGTFVRDREQISPSDFYRRHESATRPEAAPAIEPPGRGELLSIYSVGLETQNLVSLHAAPRFGSALDNAHAAAEDGLRGRVGLRAHLDPLSIEVIDSRSVSLGQGLLALAAARLASQGWSAPAIRRRLVELAAGLVVFAASREREERQRFGLFIQPVDVWSIYEIEAGELFLRDRIDREGQVAAGLLDRAQAKCGAVRPGLVGVAHGVLPDGAVALRALAAKRWPAAELVSGEIGPPLGALFGPGSLLLAALPG